MTYKSEMWYVCTMLKSSIPELDIKHQALVEYVNG